jgi:hypothetical protein
LKETFSAPRFPSDDYPHPPSFPDPLSYPLVLELDDDPMFGQLCVVPLELEVDDEELEDDVLEVLVEFVDWANAENPAATKVPTARRARIVRSKMFFLLKLNLNSPFFGVGLKDISWFSPRWDAFRRFSI